MSETYSFYADVASPEPLRLYLFHEPGMRSSHGSLDWLGWEFIARKVSPDGEEHRFADQWELTLLEILRYPDDYADHSIEWRSETTNELVDLRSLQRRVDESQRFQTALKTAASPAGDDRLVFNLYDDGKYRFTRERLVEHDGLSAWVPDDWSGEHDDLADAEDAARLQYGWFD